MTSVILLEELKKFTEQATKDLILPVRVRKGDIEKEFRAADVYRMRLPDSSRATEVAPYILHQLITGKDGQKAGDRTKASATIRTIFCVYDENEQEGALNLLNLTERLRIALLETQVIGNQFTLDMEAGIECMFYPDDTAPYYAGEMITTWELPSVERKVIL